MPHVPVVAVWLAVLPLAAIIVNVTLAPETGEPPFKTVAPIGTVPGAVKLEPDTDKLTVSVGVLITVRFPVPVPTYDRFEALALTAYVPAAVPVGGVCIMARELLWPGLRLMELAEKVAVNPEGWVEEGVNVLAEHPEESLFMTFIV